MSDSPKSFLRWDKPFYSFPYAFDPQATKVPPVVNLPLVPNGGYYGGKGFTAGEYGKDTYEIAPPSPTDRLYMFHDIDTGFVGNSPALIRDADTRLTTGLRKLLESPEGAKLPSAEQLFARGAIAWFEGRTLANDILNGWRDMPPDPIWGQSVPLEIPLPDTGDGLPNPWVGRAPVTPPGPGLSDGPVHEYPQPLVKHDNSENQLPADAHPVQGASAAAQIWARLKAGPRLRTDFDED